VTRTPLSRSKGQRPRSPGRFTHRGLNASGSYSGERGNVLGVWNYCYVAVYSVVLGASAPTEGGEGRGHIVAAARPPTACSTTSMYRWLRMLLCLGLHWINCCCSVA